MASHDEHIAKMVEYYARMALTPGWVVYARHRVSELQKTDKMYAELGVKVKKRMDEMKENDD
jgi:hypothetical protein